MKYIFFRVEVNIIRSMMTIFAKAAGSGSVNEIFNDVLADRWVNITDDPPDFFYTSEVELG